MSKLHLCCLRAATLLVAAAFSAATAFAQDRPPSKDLIRVAVGVDAAFSALYLAKQEKLFEKHGLNVQLIQFTQGGDGVDALVAGVVELASAGESTQLPRAVRADIRAITTFSQSGKITKLVARKGIEDVKQIKKYGIVPGSSNEFSTIKLLAKYNIDPKSVEFIKGGPPEFPGLLAKGDVDAYFMWEPWPTIAVKQAGGKVLMNSADVGYSYNMMISARAPWLATHKPEARAFIAALTDACDEIRATPSKAGIATNAEIKMPVDAANEVAAQIEWKVRPFTAEDIANYEAIAEFLYSRKITPSKADAAKLVQNGLDQK